ncbi:MAG: lipid II flippase MurJ [Gemmatimonadaceae bacterium]
MTGVTAVLRSSFRRITGEGQAGRLRGILLRFSLVSAFVKVIGFSRSAAIAALVGAGAHLDAYFATQVIMGIVVITFADQFEMVVGQRVRFAADTNGDAGVRDAGSRLFGLSLALGGLCAVVYIAVYPLLNGWLANPGAVVARDEYVRLALVFLPFVAMYLPYRTICALLKGAGKYNVSFRLDAAQAIVYFILTVAFLSLTRESTSSAVIAVSAAQVVSQGLLLLVAIWSARRYLSTSDAWRPRLANVREFLGETGALYLFGVLFFGFTILDRHFAAISLVGGLSLLSFASTISNTVRSVLSFEQVFGIEFGTAGSRQDILTRAVGMSLRVGIPAAVIQSVFATELMRVAFQRGRFSAQDAAGGATVLVVYGLATVVFLVWPILLRMLQAMGGLTQAFKLLPAGLLAALVSGLVLVPRIGLPGAVAATGIGHLVLVVGGILMLRKLKLHAFSARDAAVMALRILTLSMAALAIRFLVIAPDLLILRLGVSVTLVLGIDALLVVLFNSRMLPLRQPPTHQ